MERKWIIPGLALSLLLGLPVMELTDGGELQGRPPSGAVTDLRVEKGRVAGGLKVIRLKQGESANLSWTSDTPITVHLHGYDIEKKIVPGEAALMSFKAHAAGRFPIEAHVPGDKKGGHRTLIYVEVLPP